MILNAVTTADDQAIDPIRMGMVVGGVAMIGLSAVAVIINKQPFDPLLFGGGIGAIFGGGGVGLMTKAKDEATPTDVQV